MSIILNDQLIAGGGSGGGGGDSGANLDLSNLSTAGNSRLQYAPFAINAGTVLNGENNTLYTNSEIHYFKRNVTEVGTLTKNKSIISGFSSSNYANSTVNWLNSIASGNTLEFVVSFTTGSTLSNYETILMQGVTQESLGYNAIGFDIYGSKMQYVYSYTQSFQVVTGTITLQPNTQYMAKLIFTGTQVLGYLSTDRGNSWQLNGSGNTTAKLKNSTYNPRIGYSSGGSYNIAFAGSVDLASCYLKVDDTIAWQGIIDGTSSDYDYSEGVGTQVICDPCTITTCDGRTKIFDTATSIDATNKSNSSYSIFKDYETGNLSLVDNFKISKTLTFINITSEGTAISGGVHSGYSLANAFDGNISTKWGSSQQGINVPNNAYIGRSGLTEPVKKVRLYQGYDSSGTNYCAEIKVQYSNDGTNWIDIDTITGGANLTWQEWILPNYTPSSSTHSFRLLASSSPAITTNSLWIVDELELYSTVTYSYWLDTSTIPANLKVNDVINNNLVYIGDCTVSGGVITALTNREFNNSEYSINPFNASASFPSDKYVDLTLGASGTTYTAPANGWFSFSKFSSGAEQYVMLQDNTNGEPSSNSHSAGSNAGLRIFLPVRKGQIITAIYTAGGSLIAFRFIYAQGSADEA